MGQSARHPYPAGQFFSRRRPEKGLCFHEDISPYAKLAVIASEDQLFPIMTDSISSPSKKR